MKILMLFFAGLLLFAGCAQAPPTENGMTLGKPFQLKVGESAVFKTENFNITLVKVGEDSRCPTDVVCVWAGEVKVWLKVEKMPNPKGEIYSTEFEMVKGAGDSPSEKSLSDYNGKYTLELKSVDPYPKSPGQIEQSDYVVTLELTKTG